ncbi:MAG: hypothetical protein SCALA702_06500 [Melioribacteraceae bacterium]|nr:MAG: hypothetical protein SCALA702_06500 [Melioribacteraceae bacterium]
MKKLLIIILFCASSFLAQSYTKINTYSDSTQRDPQIGYNSSGQFVVVWDSEDELAEGSQSDIFYRKFDASGNPTSQPALVNDITDNEQEKPAIDMNDNGAYVITWASYSEDGETISDIKAKFFNAGSSSQEFSVNTTTAFSQTEPDVAIFEDNSFIIVWESWNQDGSNRGVYYQKFDAGQNKIGDETLVNTTTDLSQARPVVKAFPDGKFIIAWESWGQVEGITPGYDIYAKIYDNDGTVITDEFRLNQFVNDFQWYADIDIKNDSEFAAVWCSWSQDGHDGSIFMNQFNTAGERLFSEKMINKTTEKYQWLPNVKYTNSDDIMVVWSSWRQDGSREGVYCRLFDSELKALSLETLVNENKEGYQWEPVFMPLQDNTIRVIYSDWESDELDYEIIMAEMEPTISVGTIIPGTYEHSEGTSTVRFYVHVIDSTALTGDEYEISFDVGETPTDIAANIKNLNTTQMVVEDFSLRNGEKVFYLTPVFDGIAVEIIPEYSFEIDGERSNFINNSGSNLIFTAAAPSGTQSLAPIDIAVIWGSTDTLAGGNWANPIDTAYASNGQLAVNIPFTAWSITDNEKVYTYILEDNPKNNRWDPDESIVFLTPSRYDPNFPRFHGQLLNDLPAGELILPQEGDTNMVLTSRPVTDDDKFTFTASSGNMTNISESGILPEEFSLSQNFPNPFNPSTNIYYNLPEAGHVKLFVYNILGERVAELVNKEMNKGNYKVEFNALRFASGVYIYTLEHKNKILSRKMMLVK